MKPAKIFPALLALILVSAGAATLPAEKTPVEYVNPFLGSTSPSRFADIGFHPPKSWGGKVWGGLTFPGASLPNAMVQLSPVTKFKSGSGYEYEDDTILAFTHTNKGHWNLCNIPIMPVTGRISADDFSSRFNHKNESASPGYYQVFLERYKINAEFATTLRCGFHRYTLKSGRPRLVVNLAVSNENVRDWQITEAGENAFQGYQQGRDKIYFYATASRKIKNIEMLKGRDHRVPVINFAGATEGGILEIKIGISFVSLENARQNLETEIAGKDFETVRAEASVCWEKLLSKIKVTGGAEKQKGMFYSCLYRAFLWPALRGDVNGEFKNERGRVVRKNFSYYTTPSLWDDYRNKLVLLGMLAPEVTGDVIQSMIDRGESTGYMPTFFHGDHAAVFVAGSYLRGIRGFDADSACKLLVKNATEPGAKNRARPYLSEYMELGYVPTPMEKYPDVGTKSTAGVTKTLEYAYDDYALALLARELKDEKTHEAMMKRSRNYANVFDASTGLMRGRQENGEWVAPFDPQHPYYEYMYREANAWQSSFFAPHDTNGLIKLYPDARAFERQLDKLFLTPWNPRHIARNINSFIGQYCHGNQPDHGFPYLYYWVGRQEKSQILLNLIMDRFYGMSDGITLCGMDDAGEMTSWYVFNAIGLYPYSPADGDYIITVPLFDKITMELDGGAVTIVREGSGQKIAEITCGEKKLPGYFVSHGDLLKGQRLIIKALRIQNPPSR
ncbi:MAG: GH92 family glycosyl hydrolase [Opitutaceae bacterium]|jgi:predicted alpha-1,2-mannosidase|nr:GH92 family glycosyl hydrolase [Opitutaceae bacterium]